MAITFENRAVAFIDILGFRSLVYDAEANSTAATDLANLVGLLSGAIPNFNRNVAHTVPVHLIPAHNYFSDSIILSAPLTDQSNAAYRGIEVVAMRVMQLTHYFLANGYLLRGGLAVGAVWHQKNNIVGPAFQDAYLTEQCATEPCVELHHSAVTALKQCNATDRMFIESKGRQSRWFRPATSGIVVNGLHWYYIPNNHIHGQIEKQYADYGKIIDGALASALKKKPKAKWKWMRHYLRDETGNKWASAGV